MKTNIGKRKLRNNNKKCHFTIEKVIYSLSDMPRNNKNCYDDRPNYYEFGMGPVLDEHASQNNYEEPESKLSFGVGFAAS